MMQANRPSMSYALAPVYAISLVYASLGNNLHMYQSLWLQLPALEQVILDLNAARCSWRATPHMLSSFLHYRALLLPLNHSFSQAKKCFIWTKGDASSLDALYFSLMLHAEMFTAAVMHH